MTLTHVKFDPCPLHGCDGSGVIDDGNGVEHTCTCPLGLELKAELDADIAKGGQNDEGFICDDTLDQDDAYEGLSGADKLRALGAPVWAYTDTKDKACCADGLCKECESVI